MNIIEQKIKICQDLLSKIPIDPISRRRNWMDSKDLTNALCEHYLQIKDQISESKFSSAIGLPQATLSQKLRDFEKNIKSGMTQNNNTSLPLENLTRNMPENTTLPPQKSVEAASASVPQKPSIQKVPSSPIVEERKSDGGKTVTLSSPREKRRTIIGTSETGDIIIKMVITRVIRRESQEYQEFFSDISIPDKYFDFSSIEKK